MDVQEIHRITQGDTRTPLAASLKQKDADGIDEAVNLTGLSVKFCMSNEDDVAKVVLQVATITEAATGKVQYDFAAADVDTSGTYYAWFVVYTADGLEVDTFPAEGKVFQIEIEAKHARS